MTPYEGLTLRGCVKQTFLRGQLVYDAAQGFPMEHPIGQLLWQAAANNSGSDCNSGGTAHGGNFLNLSSVSMHTFEWILFILVNELFDLTSGSGTISFTVLYPFDKKRDKDD